MHIQASRAQDPPPPTSPGRPTTLCNILTACRTMWLATMAMYLEKFVGEMTYLRAESAQSAGWFRGPRNRPTATSYSPPFFRAAFSRPRLEIVGDMTLLPVESTSFLPSAR